METIIAKIRHDVDSENENKSIYKKAGDILKQGGLVAFPTETVYGLGGNALDSEASSKIYAAKGRPSDNPLIVHIADIEALYKLSIDVNESALKLAKHFWPGPLTMILKKSAIVPETITGGLNTVAIRMPSHPVAKRLIQESGIYIAAPSANTSGKPSPTKAEHVISDMKGRIDMIIEDDTVDIGVESTIVDLSEEVPTILRPGYITKQMLEEVLGEVRVDPAIMGSVKEGIVPKAPGMKYKHYAPKAEMVLVLGDDQEKVVNHINQLAKEQKEQGKKIGIIASDETKDLYQADEVVSVGQRAHLETVTAHLYDVLREFDHKDVDMIYSEGFEGEPLSEAIMNRMVKAAGHEILRI